MIGVGMGAGVGYTQGRRINHWLGTGHQWFLASTIGISGPFVVGDVARGSELTPRSPLPSMLPSAACWWGYWSGVCCAAGPRDGTADCRRQVHGRARAVARRLTSEWTCRRGGLLSMVYSSMRRATADWLAPMAATPQVIRESVRRRCDGIASERHRTGGHRESTITAHLEAGSHYSDSVYQRTSDSKLCHTATAGYWA